MATLNIKNFPDELYQRLKLQAKASERSIAQEVTHILNNTVRPVRTRSLLELRGLGAEMWKQIDTDEYIREMRGAWD